MNKANLKNEIIKRKYRNYLSNAEGVSPATISSIYRAILIFEQFTGYRDFGYNFNPDKIISFKKWLKKANYNGKSISLSTYHTYIRSLKKFFTWLCTQTGYKSKIKTEAISYLKLTNKEEKIATFSKIVDFPDLDYVKKLAESINCTNEIDIRDRALICFTALTGMRDAAIISLPVKCVDIKNKTVNQSPNDGVNTKFAKTFPSKIFEFDTELIGYIEEWFKHIKENKKFNDEAPLFPRSKVKQNIGNNMSFDSADEVEPVFWQNASSMRKIFKFRAEQAGIKYFHPHTFRHFAIDLALKQCKTGEHLKAISQNFGHENVITTIGSYGNYPPPKLKEILNKIDFTGKEEAIDSTQKAKLIDLIQKM